MTRQRQGYFLLLIGILVLLAVNFTSPTKAQNTKQLTPTIRDSRIFESNETLIYDLDFRWGLIRGRVGEAILTNRSTSNGQYFSQLLFRTRGIGDTFFKVRDTLETLYSAQKLPLRFEKRIDEGGYRFHDIVTFTHLPDNRARVYVRAAEPDRVHTDSTYYVSTSEAEVIDMLSALAYLRSFDHKKIERGFLNRFLIPIGKDLVHGDYEFGGYENIKMPDGSSTEAIKIYFNIKDESFSQTSRSIEAWVTNDEKLIPVKIIAKLSIGRVVCSLTNYRSN